MIRLVDKCSTKYILNIYNVDTWCWKYKVLVFMELKFCIYQLTKVENKIASEHEKVLVDDEGDRNVEDALKQQELLYTTGWTTNCQSNKYQRTHC